MFNTVVTECICLWYLLPLWTSSGKFTVKKIFRILDRGKYYAVRKESSQEKLSCTTKIKLLVPLILNPNCINFYGLSLVIVFKYKEVNFFYTSSSFPLGVNDRWAPVSRNVITFWTVCFRMQPGPNTTF